MIISTTPCDTTSACGAMLAPIRQPALVGVMLVGLGFGTSSALAHPVQAQPAFGLHANTTSGTGVVEVGNSSAALSELRRRSGFTWDQLSRLFGVSRRSVHFWISGKPMTPANEEHLQRLLGVMRSVDRGSPDATRSALFEVGADGVAPFNLLVGRQYQLAQLLLGTPTAIGVIPRRQLPGVLAARSPLPPDQLVGALQDRVHTERGVARPAASVKARRVRGGS